MSFSSRYMRQLDEQNLKAYYELRDKYLLQGEKMQYLVCRMDALRPNGQMKTSEYFPMLVESYHGSEEDIVRKALDTINKGYVGMHEYIVVPLIDAKVVSFKPRQSYDVDTRSFSL